jgi:hypothetical protein
MQSTLEVSMVRWIATFFRREMEDSRESRTAIGRTGRVRLSGNIIYRVTPDKGSPPPELLREASFDSYDRGVWLATTHEMSSALVDTNDVAFLLAPKPVKFTAHISRYLHNGAGLLAVPHGTFELHDLPVISLTTNRLGVLKVDEGPAFVNYQALYGPGESIDCRPGPMDLKVPDSEQAVLEEMVESLGLREKSDLDKVRTLDRFFQEKFRYTLNLNYRRDAATHKTAVGQFLTEGRAGHCEYFATATVLLLRKAGVAARYVTGYVVEERAAGGSYVVRERHGHAWVLVYRDDLKQWVEVDTTPGYRGAMESQEKSAWESVSDFFSRIKFEFNRWRQSKSSYTTYLSWALGFLILLLAWRLIFTRRRKHTKKSPVSIFRDWPGLDSEYPKVEEDLSGAGLGRLPGERFEAWSKRVELPDKEQLYRLFRLHRRLRFDPMSVNAAERQELRRGVQEWRRRFGGIKRA